MKGPFAFTAALAALPAVAQTSNPDDVVPLEPIVVTATRGETRLFDTPASVSVVDGSVIRLAGPQVNLSEALSRVPGVTILNRQNYAQDLQLSIRGFGSRSTFGIRGVRLVVDGIPATMPDGQGQASNIMLSSTSRIEVLRGPLALLYGNSAGGVVQAFTEAGSPQPTVSLGGSAGSYDARRFDAQLSATTGPHAYTLDAATFSTDGYRDHSEARRDQLNGKWRWDVSGATRLETVVNVIDQPHSLDPLGLTRAQWEENPRQAPAIAYTQDASKTVRQKQVGTVLDHAFDDRTQFTARAYVGQRDLENALSTPLANQLAPTSAGGIVVFERIYAGAAAQVARRFTWDAGIGGRVVAGVEYDRMEEDRQGYINNAGQRGALKRDEDNTVYNGDAFVLATLDLGERWSVAGGARYSGVHFKTQDHYIAPGNPDDSGSLDFSATSPAFGLTWHAAPSVNVYANAGRGFETPTFTELAYRNGASGLNTSLNASKSRHGELGVKWRIGSHAIDAAIYEIRTRDEIVVDTNVGGRSTFRNAGGTTRRGAEVSANGALGADFRYTLSATRLDATFDSGGFLPATPDKSAFAELAWVPRAWPGLQAGVEVVHTGRLYVNDANEDSAPSATVMNLRLAYTWRFGRWEATALARLENATDRSYAGSVIVNEANRRFFEPAPPRNALGALTMRYRF